MLLPELLKRYKNDSSPTEIYEWNRKIWSQHYYELTYCSYCIFPFDKSKCIMNGQLRNLIKWINLNIVKNIDIDTIETIRVKLRIATGMLNKINLSDVEKIEIHSNLIRNINLEKEYIINSELPF